jgi:hypothetical protein
MCKPQEKDQIKCLIHEWQFIKAIEEGIVWGQVIKNHMLP